MFYVETAINNVIYGAAGMQRMIDRVGMKLQANEWNCVD